VGLQREGLVQRPGLDVAAGDVGHQRAVGLHALAVEGGQHELALAQVRGPVEQEHGVVAEDAREHGRVGLAGAQHVRIGGEGRLDVGRVAEEHDVADLVEADGEDVAVVAPAAAHERVGADDPAGGLKDLGERGSGG
jgi:hypothetical protein